MWSPNLEQKYQMFLINTVTACLTNFILATSHSSIEQSSKLFAFVD